MTVDLLSYLRCRLQYRYRNGSTLPPSRPVQQWFGEFLHRTLELALRFWANNHENHPFPCPCTQRAWRENSPDWESHDIGKFTDTVETALNQQGKEARSRNARNSSYQSVVMSVNQLVPHLFPLIASAEKTVIGKRVVLNSHRSLRCSNYEVHSVIDALTNVTPGDAADNNLISRCVEAVCPNLSGTYEVSRAATLLLRLTVGVRKGSQIYAKVYRTREALNFLSNFLQQ